MASKLTDFMAATTEAALASSVGVQGFTIGWPTAKSRAMNEAIRSKSVVFISPLTMLGVAPDESGTRRLLLDRDSQSSAYGARSPEPTLFQSGWNELRKHQAKARSHNKLSVPH